MNIDTGTYLHLLNKVHSKKSSKYRNKKVFYDNRWWDSKKEYHQYLILKVKKKQGDIKNFQCQPIIRFPCKIKYIPDFKVTYKNGKIIYYDVKSKATKTPVYRIKIKLLKYFYPNINFEEII